MVVHLENEHGGLKIESLGMQFFLLEYLCVQILFWSFLSSTLLCPHIFAFNISASNLLADSSLTFIEKWCHMNMIHKITHSLNKHQIREAKTWKKMMNVKIYSQNNYDDFYDINIKMSYFVGSTMTNSIKRH